MLNTMGYAAGQAGDLDAAMSALRRYAALRPNEPNPLDSMGDVNLSAGRFADAENFYLQSFKKDPNFENNERTHEGGAGPSSDRRCRRAPTTWPSDIWLRARKPRTTIVDYRRAQWSWISGRRKAAAQQMGAFALAAESGPLRDIASRAYAELAIWSLMSGDRDGAARLAQKALSIAGPASAGNALVARFLAQPPAGSSEWAVRAEQQFPGPAQTAIKNFSLAYALLINQQFQPAMLLLKQMWESRQPDRRRRACP